MKLINRIIVVLSFAFNLSLCADDNFINGMDSIITNLKLNDISEQLPPQEFPYCMMEYMLKSRLLVDVTQSRVDSLISTPNFFARAEAAAILSKGVVYDTSASLTILIQAMEDILVNPLPITKLDNREVQLSGSLMYQYCLAIANLLGKGNESLVEPYLIDASDEVKTNLTLAMGFIGGHDIHNQVRNIFYTTNNIHYKLFADFVLSLNPDSLDIPVFLSGINDFYLSDETNDNFQSMFNYSKKALEKLGYSIEKQGDKYIIIRNDE